MDPEDRVADYFWWVLQRIKEESLITERGKPIDYRHTHVMAPGVPSLEKERRIIYKLQESGAIKILEDIPPDWSVDFPGMFDLEIVQPKFDEVYYRYRKITSKVTKFITQLSRENYAFVHMILKEITRLAEVSPDDEVYYTMQMHHPQDFITERAFLTKLDALGLLHNAGEDGLSGSVTLKNINIAGLKEIIAAIKQREEQQDTNHPNNETHPTPLESNKDKDNKDEEDFEWPQTFQWQDVKTFNLGNGQTITFSGTKTDRIRVFKKLSDAKGGWVKVADMAKLIEKKEDDVRTILGQLNGEKCANTKTIIIVPRNDAGIPGAYRIKILHPSQA